MVWSSGKEDHWLFVLIISKSCRNIAQLCAGTGAGGGFKPQGKWQQTVETQKRAHPWLQQSQVERRGRGVILPMSVLMLKMSLPKMIILFDDYNRRHQPVEVKIIQLPKKLDGELTNGLSTKISINALFWLKPGKLKRIPCIPQMLLEVKKI